MSLVGFIGLGNMGAHMARHLMRNGHELIVYDVNKKVLEQFKTEGCEAAEHPAEIASASKSILTMLPNSSHIKDVFTADNGLLRNMQPGTLCMDSSTIDHVVSVEIAALCNAKQSVYVDAPVSGGVKGAHDATLTFMVGSGECEKTFTRAKEYLKCMGKNIVDCGKVGNGQTAKICNNMLAGISMIAVAETINLGIKMGLSGKQLTDIINTSSGRCWSSDTYNPVPGVIEGIPPSSNYNGGFACSLMAKDLSLAQNAATNMQTSIPMGSLAHQIYRLMAQHPDFSNKDFGAIYRFLSEP